MVFGCHVTLFVHIKDVLNNVFLEKGNMQIRNNTYITNGFKVNYNSFRTYLTHFKLSKICFSGDSTTKCVSFLNIKLYIRLSFFFHFVHLRRKQNYSAEIY